MRDALIILLGCWLIVLVARIFIPVASPSDSLSLTLVGRLYDEPLNPKTEINYSTTAALISADKQQLIVKGKRDYYIIETDEVLQTLLLDMKEPISDFQFEIFYPPEEAKKNSDIATYLRGFTINQPLTDIQQKWMDDHHLQDNSYPHRFSSRYILADTFVPSADAMPLKQKVSISITSFPFSYFVLAKRIVLTPVALIGDFLSIPYYGYLIFDVMAHYIH